MLQRWYLFLLILLFSYFYQLAKTIPKNFSITRMDSHNYRNNPTNSNASTCIYWKANPTWGSLCPHFIRICDGDCLVGSDCSSNNSRPTTSSNTRPMIHPGAFEHCGDCYFPALAIIFCICAKIFPYRLKEQWRWISSTRTQSQFKISHHLERDHIPVQYCQFF